MADDGLAAGPLASGALESGDRLPEFALPLSETTTLSLAAVSLGKPVVLFFCRDLRSESLKRLMFALHRVHERLLALAHVAFVSDRPLGATTAFAKHLELPFPLFSDPDRQSFRDYGLASEQEEAVSCVIADAQRRLLRLDRRVAAEGYFEPVLALLAALPAPPPLELGPAAPVLYLPGVFEAGFCRRLIEAYATGAQRDSTVLRVGAPEGERNLVSSARKIRRDHLVTEPELVGRIVRDLRARVMPEIRKAFQFRVDRSPWFKIGCYRAESGGFFGPHRDDTTPRSRYRRFALTLNLNTGDYEGGHLRFPEYGPQLYRPAAGDAIVFSCSLVHEVLPVTAGARYALITFFYGEDSRHLPQDRLV